MLTRIIFNFFWLQVTLWILTTTKTWAASPFPDFDRRRDALPAPLVSAERVAAQQKLSEIIPGVRVDYDPLTGTPAWISCYGWLTKHPEQEMQRTGNLGLSEDDPLRPLKAFLIENKALFGHGPEALETALLQRDYVTLHNGLHTYLWQQQLDGIPIFEAVFKTHITRDKRLVNIASHFLPDPTKLTGLDENGRFELRSKPPVPAEQALLNALADVGEVEDLNGLQLVSKDDLTQMRRQAFSGRALQGIATSELIWLPVDRTSVKLCWRLIFHPAAILEGFQSLIDVSSGEILVRQCLNSEYSSVKYTVYPGDSPAPLSPGLSAVSATQAQNVSRQVIQLSNGWITSGQTTVGPNVDASTINTLNQDGSPNQVLHPQGTVNNNILQFDFPIDLTQNPNTYQSASSANLFYWCNWMHDQLYSLGFTESCGSFQDSSQGSNKLIAYAQNTWRDNNSFFHYTPNGQSTLNLGVYSTPAGKRDAALDTTCILHEYTHGLCLQLIAGGSSSGSFQTQTAGMAEGWADFYSTSLLSQSTDDVNANYPVFSYVSYKLPIPDYRDPDDLNWIWTYFDENYYFGIRRYPYTTDMSKNPLTFADIDSSQANNCSSSAPWSPLSISWNPDNWRSWTCGLVDPTEVHMVGEVWCSILWEVRAKLIGYYGWSGNQIMLQLVTDSMKLSGSNPTFVQARDSFLEALSNSSYCNQTVWNRVWEGFAKRGLGLNAIAPASTGTSGGTESFTTWPQNWNGCSYGS